MIQYFNKIKILKQDFFYRLIQTSSKEGFVFLLFLITANSVSSEEFGILSYVMAIAMLMIFFVNFGLSSAVTRYTAEFAVNKKYKINKIVSSISSLIFGLFVILFFALFLLRNLISTEIYFLILNILPFILFKSLSGVIDGIYRGLKYFKKAGVIAFFVFLICCPLSIYLILLFGISGFIFSIDIYYFLTFFLNLLFLIEKSFCFDFYIVKKVTKYAIWVGLASLSYFLYSKIDILIMKEYNLIVEIGYYEFINRIFEMIIFPFIILGQVLGPTISKYNAKKKYKKILNILSVFFKTVIPISLLISVGLFVLMPIVISTFFISFNNILFYKAFNILLFLMPLYIWSSFLTHGLIVPSGMAKILTLTTFIFGILNIVFDYLLIPNFGYIGVVYATLICHVLNVFFQSMLYIKYLKKYV